RLALIEAAWRTRYVSRVGGGEERRPRRLLVDRLAGGREGVDEKHRRIRLVYDELPRLGEIRPGSAVRQDDALRQQVGDRLVVLWPIGSKDMVESPVLADQDDQVLDWRGGLDAAIGVSIAVIVSRRQTAGHQSAKDSTQCRQALPAHSLRNS